MGLVVAIGLDMRVEYLGYTVVVPEVDLLVALDVDFIVTYGVLPVVLVGLVVCGSDPEGFVHIAGWSPSVLALMIQLLTDYVVTVVGENGQYNVMENCTYLVH